MSAIDDVLDEAHRYVGVMETPPGSNRGLEVDYWLHEAHVPLGLPWCAAFVGQVGRQALGTKWPCPRTALVADLAAWGATRGLVYELPLRGDILLLWEGDRFAHTGFVVHVDAAGYDAIEGNTNVDGSREGVGVMARRRTRHVSDRFLRWAEVSA